MALIKEQQTKFGMPAAYWRVSVLTVDTRLKEANFALDLYLNKEAEVSFDTICVCDLMGQEDKAMYNKYFGLNNGDYKDWQTACYMYAKENVEFFKDAKDDEDYQQEQIS